MVDKFAILILTHLVSDFFFHPYKWAISEKFKHVFLHSIQYSLLFIPVLYFLEINLFWLIWIFTTHLFIDGVDIGTWFAKNIQREKNPPFWLGKVREQILHVLVLVVVLV